MLKYTVYRQTANLAASLQTVFYFSSYSLTKSCTFSSVVDQIHDTSGEKACEKL